MDMEKEVYEMGKEIFEMGKEIFDYLKDNFRIYTIEECEQLEKDKGAYGVIYITQCKINKKMYIGQKKIDRPDFDTYLGSGTILKQAVEKYGKDNFERIILEVAYSQEELDSFEIKYIELFEASEEYNDLFYNIALGGHTGGVCLKGENSPNYKPRVIFKCGYCGKEIEKLESYTDKASNTFCSKECRKKWLSEQMRGENNPKYKEKVTFKCGYCGKEIEKLESYKNNKSNIFCDKECFKKWQKEYSPSYKGFIIIFQNGQVSKEMTRDEVVNYLNVSKSIIADLAREKTCYIGRCEHIRYIRVLHLQDYLKERELYKEDFKNMCKRMVEEAKILYKIKKEEYSKAHRKKGLVKNNPNYEKPISKERKKKEAKKNQEAKNNRGIENSNINDDKAS